MLQIPNQRIVLHQKPVLIAPTNGKLCIDNIVNFQWNISVDPEGDVISYLIQVATDNQFNQVAHTFSISATSKKRFFRKRDSLLLESESYR